MTATIPLATGNKLNCFISAKGMLAIVWYCVLLFCCCFFCVCWFVDFLHVNKSSSQKKNLKNGCFLLLFQFVKGSIFHLRHVKYVHKICPN